MTQISLQEGLSQNPLPGNSVLKFKALWYCGGFHFGLPVSIKTYENPIHFYSCTSAYSERLLIATT